MKNMKAYLVCLGNFLLGALGVVGVGWFILLKYPNAKTTVYIIGGILILMCLWSAIEEMNRKLKRPQKSDLPAETNPTKDTGSQPKNPE